MSTSEITISEMCTCPCAAGCISQHLTTQDNPWSSADIDYTIDCPRCRNEWRLDGTMLVLRSSESAYLAAKMAEEASARPLRSLVDQLVADYFVCFAATTKKAEHNEMARLAITSLSYNQYLKRRRHGDSLIECCYGLHNKVWLRSLAAAQSREADLDRLIAANDSARQATNDAYKAIVRQGIS